MLAVVRVVLADHLKSFRWIPEVVLLALFLVMGAVAEVDVVSLLAYMVGLFAVVLFAVTTLHVCARAASLKCHYLIAGGAGRVGYFFGVALAAVIAALPFLVVGTAVMALQLSRSDGAILARVYLLLGIMFASAAVSVFFSRLVLPRFGAVLAAVLLLYLALASPDSFGARAERYVRIVHAVLPPINASLEAASADTPPALALLLARLVAFPLVLLAIALFVFVRKDLTFEE